MKRQIKEVVRLNYKGGAKIIAKNRGKEFKYVLKDILKVVGEDVEEAKKLMKDPYKAAMIMYGGDEYDYSFGYSFENFINNIKDDMRKLKQNSLKAKERGLTDDVNSFYFELLKTYRDALREELEKEGSLEIFDSILKSLFYTHILSFLYINGFFYEPHLSNYVIKRPRDSIIKFANRVLFDNPFCLNLFNGWSDMNFAIRFISLFMKEGEIDFLKEFQKTQEKVQREIKEIENELPEGFWEYGKFFLNKDEPPFFKDYKLALKYVTRITKLYFTKLFEETKKNLEKYRTNPNYENWYVVNWWDVFKKLVWDIEKKGAIMAYEESATYGNGVNDVLSQVGFGYYVKNKEVFDFLFKTDTFPKIKGFEKIEREGISYVSPLISGLLYDPHIDICYDCPLRDDKAILSPIPKVLNYTIYSGDEIYFYKFRFPLFPVNKDIIDIADKKVNETIQVVLGKIREMVWEKIKRRMTQRDGKTKEEIFRKILNILNTKHPPTKPSSIYFYFKDESIFHKKDLSIELRQPLPKITGNLLEDIKKYLEHADVVAISEYYMTREYEGYINIYFKGYDGRFHLIESVNKFGGRNKPLISDYNVYPEWFTENTHDAIESELKKVQKLIRVEFKKFLEREGLILRVKDLNEEKAHSQGVEM